MGNAKSPSGDEHRPLGWETLGELAGLNRRHSRIVARLAQGHDVFAIARHFCTDPHYIRTVLRSIRGRLRVKTDLELVSALTHLLLVHFEVSHSAPGKRHKKRITIRIDEHVLDWYKQQAEGSYQIMINQVLYCHMLGVEWDRSRRNAERKEVYRKG